MRVSRAWIQHVSLRREAVGRQGCALLSTTRGKGDYGFNVFHNSNPQHGGSYARHERRMREDEVADFFKSVKGWKLVWGEAEGEIEEALTSDASGSATEGPTASRLHLGDEAIMKTFTFATYEDAYRFMGRLWAFCYAADKYPHVKWEHTSITVYLYSPSFKGLSKREARVAAFLNDQFNMFKKSAKQQQKVLEGVVQHATVEEIMGKSVKQALEKREALRRAPLDEAGSAPKRWEELLNVHMEEKKNGSPEQ